jgi:hypothetical protein
VTPQAVWDHRSLLSIGKGLSAVKAKQTIKQLRFRRTWGGFVTPQGKTGLPSQPGLRVLALKADVTVPHARVSLLSLIVGRVRERDAELKGKPSDTICTSWGR